MRYMTWEVAAAAFVEHDRSSLSPVDVADERVGDHEDVVGVGAQGCQDAGDVVADAIMRIEVEVDDSAVSSGHVGPLRQSWSEQVRTSQSWSISTTLAVPVSHAEPSAH